MIRRSGDRVIGGSTAEGDCATGLSRNSEIHANLGCGGIPGEGGGRGKRGQSGHLAIGTSGHRKTRKATGFVITGLVRIPTPFCKIPPPHRSIRADQNSWIHA